MAIRRGIGSSLVFAVSLSVVACAGGGGEGLSSGDGDGDGDGDEEQGGDEMEVGEKDVDAPTRELCEHRASEKEDTITLIGHRAPRSTWFIRDVGANDTHVYWVEQPKDVGYDEEGPMEIYRVGLEGPDEQEGELFASMTVVSGGNVIAGSEYLFVLHDDSISRFSTSGSLLDTTEVGYPAGASAYNQDEDKIYFKRGLDSIVAFDKLTATVETVAEDLGDMHEFAVDEEHLYFTVDTGRRVPMEDLNDNWEVLEIFKTPKTGGEVRSLGTAFAHVASTLRIFSAGAYLYIGTTDQRMGRAAKDGSGIEWLFPEHSCEEVGYPTSGPHYELFPTTDGVFFHDYSLRFTGPDGIIIRPFEQETNWFFMDPAVTHGDTLYFLEGGFVNDPVNVQAMRIR